MPAVLTPGFRVANAQTFMGALDSDANRLYMVIGRTLPWEPNDTEPPTPNAFDPTGYWNEAIAARRVTGSDAIIGCRRINWTSGTVYTPYESGLDVGTANHFVVTPEYNVYKCLDNFGGVASTVVPQGQSLGSITTADGYRWKFMCSVTPGDASRFLTADYIPLRTNELVEAAALPGVVERVKVTVPGSGYSTAAVSITGDGTGAAANAVIVGGQIVRIDITNVGSGYSYATATITGDGVGAEAEAVLPPVRGHGSDLLMELGGYNVLVSNLLEPGLANFPTSNDYRRLMYVQNPILEATQVVAAGLTYNLTYGVVVEHVSGSTAVGDDEVLTGSVSAAQFALVEQTINGSTQFHITYLTPHQLEDGDTFVTAAGGLWNVIDANYREPLWQPYTGQVMFVDHRRPIMRSDDQIENIVTVFEF